MASIIQVKRRNTGGSGAPSSLKSGEIAWQNVDKKFYVGAGDDGSGNATSIEEIAGSGAAVMLVGAQTVAGVKTFSSFPITPSSAPTTDYQVANRKFVLDSIVASGGGDMLAAVYDPQAIEDDAFDMDNHTEGTTNKHFTATLLSKLNAIEALADVTDAGNVGPAINGATGKSTPVNADKFALIDTENSNALSWVTGTNLKAFLKTYFDTLYQAAGSYITASSTDVLTNKSIDANGTGNVITNLEVDNFATNVIDNDNTLAANSATRIPTQAAVKGYVDAIAMNAGQRSTVRAATTANITIATALNSGDTLDGVTLADDDLVLVKNQTAPEENGIYVVGASPARAPDYDTWDEHPGATIIVQEGTVNADSLWLCTANSGGTLGTTAITFSQAVITGELKALNNLSDLADAATARTNLGLGTMAVQNANSVAITGGTIDGVTIDGGTF